jgi:hypothetical protein
MEVTAHLARDPVEFQNFFFFIRGENIASEELFSAIIQPPVTAS